MCMWCELQIKLLGDWARAEIDERKAARKAALAADSKSHAVPNIRTADKHGAAKEVKPRRKK